MGPLTFTVAKSDAEAANLVVAARAADNGLVPTRNLLVEGTGATRTLRLTPAADAFGTTIITIFAGRVGETSATRSFQLTVLPQNDAPQISTISDQTVVIGMPTDQLPFSVGDIETSSDLLRVTATSSDPTLIPNSNIQLTGSNQNRSVRVVPLPQRSGEATITLTVTDGSGAATQTTFNVFVAPASLTYELNGSDSITISTSDNKIVTRINGALDLTYYSIPADRVGKIHVKGGAGANLIDLSHLLPTPFRRLTSVTAEGGTGNDTIVGSSFSDSLNGGAGDDLIAGGDGGDLITSGDGSDTVNGGLGIDRIIEAGDFDMVLSTTSLQMKLPTGVVVSSDQLVDIELADLTGGPSANRIDAQAFSAIANGITQITGGGNRDTVIGTAGRDLIITFSGNDSVQSLGGGDTVYSGTGEDTVDAGDGNDQVFGQLGNDLVYGGNGNDSLMGGDGNDSLFGQSGNDRLYGLRDNDSAVGGPGDDVLFGDTGNDILRGNEGADSLIGAIGNDVLDGGADYDRVLEVSDATFLVTPGHISCPMLGVKTLLDVDQIQVTGGDGNNVIDARSAAVPVVLIGLNGDDTLLASSRNDILIGGDGDDVIVGNGGRDIVDGGAGQNLELAQLPRIAVLGDSTVATFVAAGPGEAPLEGWAQEFDNYFLTDAAAVVNHAVSGRSLKSFRIEGRWQPVVESQPDVVLIQFGQNDQLFAGPIRGSDPNGEFQEILKAYIQDARAAGILPVLVTPVSLRLFINGVARETAALTPYANAMRQVAQETGVPLIDLNQASFKLFQQLGDANSQFISRTPTDIAHFSPEGANVIAGLVATALRQAVPQLVPLMRV